LLPAHSQNKSTKSIRVNHLHHQHNGLDERKEMQDEPQLLAHPGISSMIRIALVHWLQKKKILYPTFIFLKRLE
jgi:hypothetical protein